MALTTTAPGPQGWRPCVVADERLDVRNGGQVRLAERRPPGGTPFLRTRRASVDGIGPDLAWAQARRRRHGTPTP